MGPQRGGVRVFTAAAGAVLVVAMLQESHRLAFNDELTACRVGARCRRRWRAWGRATPSPWPTWTTSRTSTTRTATTSATRCSSWVAARLAEVEGGGRAFRYGGEEFTVLFAGLSLEEALPHLEAIRASVESYPHGGARRGSAEGKEKGEKLRAQDEVEESEETLSVTISIGAAEPGGEATHAALALKAADEALYRAKRGGRNRVSR